DSKAHSKIIHSGRALRGPAVLLFETRISRTPTNCFVAHDSEWIGVIAVSDEQTTLQRRKFLQLIGFCMEIHRELGKGHDEVIYKDALVIELSRAGIPFSREKSYEITYKGLVLPHHYYADFVVWDKILFGAQGGRKINRLAHQTSTKLSRCLETSPRPGGQFRWRFLGKGWFYETQDTTSQYWINQCEFV